MPNGYELVYDENGAPHYQWHAEDGSIYVAAADGQVTAMWDPDEGAFIEAEPGWTVDDPGFPGYRDPRLVALDDRLDAIEAHYGITGDEPIEPAYAEPDDGGAYDAELTAEDAARGRAAEDAVAQLERAERSEGTRYARDERLAILSDTREDIDAGREPDVALSIERVRFEQPDRLHDLDTRQGRIDKQMALLHDGERDARMQPLDQADPPRIENPDLDDRQQRWDHMADRLEGRVGPLAEHAGATG